MFAIQVGDHAKDRRELEERAVAFIRFGHQILRFPEPRIRTHRVDPAADYDGRIQTAAGKNCGDHGGGRGFAVHAGHRDAIFQPHQLGQHLRPLDHRHVAGAGLDHLRIEVIDCRTDHHHRRAKTFAAAWPSKIVAPRPASRSVMGDRFRSEPETGYPRLSSISAIPLMPIPPIPMK